MPRYNVTMPLAGSITFYGVEADDEKAAIDAASEVDVDVSFKAGDNESVDVEINWLTHMTSGNVVHFSLSGNVVHFSLNEAYVELPDSDDEDAG